MAERVIVGMSGGVDSSVAAARLAAAGFEVIGVTLHLSDSLEGATASGRESVPAHVRDARRVAHHLGIAHCALDRRELFQSEIVTPFVEGYLQAMTPSPCVHCNPRVKLRELTRLASQLGAATVATGHYARIRRSNGRAHLYRGRDPTKDQSYFLHRLPLEVLTRLRLPLGDACKAEVRAEAQRLGLPSASKRESQELCFVPSGRYHAFVAERAGERLRPGPLVTQGQTVGTHQGIHRYTVGQRRSLGVALGRRAYVVAIDPATATVRLGGADELFCTAALLEDTVLGDDIRLPMACDVAVRYRGRLTACEVSSQGPGQVLVRFAKPMSAVVPGQCAVFFRGERVLGGGVIRKAVTPSESDRRVE
jgi:tRNA-specific 2-thiouridylase